MANKNIKGLTVEIGGDTTKLGQALEAVDKKSADLSSELGEINKLLKFNPGNADLIAQKQKVLAEQISNTSEKLKTLKEAEKQVQKQFERGEISEAQYRALQREIVATESKLDHYKDEAKKATKGTKELGDEAKETASAGEVLGKAFGAAAKGIGVAIGAGTAVMGALAGTAEASREYRGEMGKLNTAYETLGLKTETAQAAYKTLQGVIGETDQSVEAAQQIALLAESEEDVVKWSSLAAGVVGRFGDALQPETFFEAANETIKLGEATGAYVQLLEGTGYSVDEFNAGLAACTTEAEKQAYMLKITDELLGDAADRYRENNAEVIRANEANEAWAATMAEVGGSVEPVLTDVKLLGASLVSDLVPGVTSAVTAFRGLVNGEDGAAEALGTAISGLLTQVLDLAVQLLPTLVATAMSLVTQLATTLISMLPQLVETGVTIIMAIIEGLTTAIPLITQSIVDMIPLLVAALVSGIPQIIDGAVQLLLAILDAIPLILPPLVAALPQIILAIIDGLLAAIPQLIEGALQFLLAIVQAVPLLLDQLLPQVPRIVDTVIDGLLDNIDLLVDAAIQLFFGILEAIPEIQKELIESAPDIVGSIVSGLLSAIPEMLKAGGQLLQGLIDGMLDFDIVGKVSQIGGKVVDAFKDIFDIHSPSRVMKWQGEMLDEGLAVGIEDNAGAPVNALDKLSGEMLDETAGLSGLTLERRINASTAGAEPALQGGGMLTKLDQIHQAILKGQVIMLDSKVLVGSTAYQYDGELGQRRLLTERGAL